MPSALLHPPGTNLLNDPDALDDTANGARIPDGLRLRVVLRLIAIVVGCAVAFWPAWTPLVENLGDETPVAYGAVAPLIAAVLLGTALRTSPPGSPRIARRQADYVTAALVVAIGVAAALWLPGRFGFLSNELRAELVALPFVALAGCLLLFGARTAFHARASIIVLGLTSPIGYSWFLDLSTGLAWRITWAATTVGSWLFGFNAREVGGTGLVDVGDGQLLAVTAVCSGIASVAGWLVVSVAFVSLCAAPARSKVNFVLTGVAASLAANVLRVLTLILVARHWSLDVADQVVHPVAGFVALGLVVLTMMLLAPRFGLHRRPAVARSAIARIAISSPPRAVRELLAWVGIVAVVFAVTAQTWRFDQLAGQNGGPNRPAAAILDAQSDARVHADLAAWRFHDLPQVPWTEQFFGAGATWSRYLATPVDSVPLEAASADAAEQAPATLTLTVDVTTVDESSSLDRYSLAACYGFHGHEIDRAKVTGALPGRPAERILYHDDGSEVSTSVMSFRQRTVDGRIERVVVSARVPLGSEDVADEAVLRLTRSLATTSAAGDLT